MIKVTLTNEILRYIIEIEQNRYKVSSVKLSKTVMNKLRKNSKKKSNCLCVLDRAGTETSFFLTDQGTGGKY